MSIPTRRGEFITNGEIYRLMDFLGPARIEHRNNPPDEDASLRFLKGSIRQDQATIMSLADMTKDLKRSIIVIVSLIVFEKIISAEDDDDLALAKINKLFRRHPRMITLEYESSTSKDFSDQIQLESKLGDLLEFHQKGPTKLPKTSVFSSELSPFMRYDPVDKRDEEDARDETVEDDIDDNEQQETTINSPNNKTRHAQLMEAIKKKLTDKNIKITVSLPVAAAIFGSIVVVTCCCSLYLRNRFAACINKLTGKKKRKRVLPASLSVIQDMHRHFLITLMILMTFYWKMIDSTIDVNLSELEYLAGHLDPFECIRLIAALHYTTYELPKSIAGAERKVDEEIPCLRQLIHWNSSPNEGRGKTHELLEHRLRQLNRNDLADWLGKTSFKQLGNDLQKSMNKPFGDLGEQETETEYPITLDPLEESPEEDPWLPIDTLLMALLVGSLVTLGTLVIALAIHKVKLRLHRRRIEAAKKRTKKRGSRNDPRNEKVLNEP